MAGSLGSIRGAAELERALTQLGKTVASKIIQASVRAGGKPVVDAIKANAPASAIADGAQVGSKIHHKIKNNIKIKKGKSKGTDTATVLVHTGLAFHALFLERGTIHMAPKPFMKAALDSAAPIALARIGTELEKRIASAIRTLAARP